jgi:cytochrome c peroxidase
MRPPSFPILLACCLATGARAGDRTPPDHLLRTRLAAVGITPLNTGLTPHLAEVQLGRMLIDRVLGGNLDIACATCYHPAPMTRDALSLSIDTGGSGLGPTRIMDFGRPFVLRNATDLFDRGAPEWQTMFWDSRVSAESGQHQTPAGPQLPDGLAGVLATQVMFPVTGREEMRGVPGDPGNEIADLADSDFRGIWAALIARLPADRHLFADADPAVPPRRIGLQHRTADRDRATRDSL